MSLYGSFKADFRAGDLTAERLRKEPFGRYHESNLNVDEYEDAQGQRVLTVTASLRDITDNEDAPTILGWFVGIASLWCSSADLVMEFDNGPRYRYRWDDRHLIKIRGCLD